MQAGDVSIGSVPVAVPIAGQSARTAPRPIAVPPAFEEKEQISAPARPAEMRRRHKFVLISFVVVVLLPVLAAALYLYCVARDQYASTVGFVVRREAPSSSAELLGGISALGGAASSDAQALYEYLKNPDIVRAVARRVDLNTVFTNAGDPFYSLGQDRRIEGKRNEQAILRIGWVYAVCGSAVIWPAF